ncbi:ScbR family autoregulator-binding transcription factor [Streptomyces venezuelae]|uniref:ScbR family autoregulator-binding transcription factor n=1 Tax=Streptomyces venezuelae TaxID=54571 RepID=UPI0034564DC3
MSQQERATRTRNALIQAAAELFERHGYTRASLEDISTRAQVSRGALHFHFENKAALADAVEHAAAHAIRETAESTPPNPTSPLHTLMDLSHRMVHLLHHDTIVRAGFRLNCDPGPRTPLNLHQQWQAHVHHHVTQAANQQTLAPHITPHHLTATIVATTTGLEVLSRTNHNWLTPTPLTHFWQLLLPSITHPPTNDTHEPANTHAP